MKHLKTAALFLIAIWAFLPVGQITAEETTKPPSMVSKSCLTCHKNFESMKDILAGNVKSSSNKAKSIQLQINDEMEVVKYTPETTVKNVPDIKALKGTIPLRIHYKRVGSDLVATEIVAKPEMKVPEEQLISVKELEKLVAVGPEKGGYTLVDSRPGIKYKEGHIPTAVSIPFPKMNEMKEKLPSDKSRMLVFYCEGFR
ncbi:MAG: rhodanese-like domain-containing protein [Pseudomonadota bacterium]